MKVTLNFTSEKTVFQSEKVIHIELFPQVLQPAKRELTETWNST